MIVRLFSLWLLALLNSDVLPASASVFEGGPSDQGEDAGHGDLPFRIVGGSFAPVDEYPWFAMLRTVRGNTDDEFGCGGMLVSPEYVLTAAHCINWKMKNKGAVRIGAYNSPYKSGNNGGQEVEFFKANNVVTHPQYNKQTENNDFALMRLDGTAKTKPVAMDSSGISNTFSTGKGNLWAIGHGAVAQGGNGSSKLKHVQVDYVSNSDCYNKYGYSKNEITANMLCAREDNSDSCQGDSGGPLYDKTNNVLVGVVSWGNGCALQDYPGVYARVSSVYDWIKSTICEGSNSPPSWCSDSPVAAPVSSPVSSPVAVPTDDDTDDTDDSDDDNTCTDSTLKFRIKLNNKFRFKNCAWAGKNQNRCNKEGVSEFCPSTCNSCDTCVDFSDKFKVVINGKKRNKDCSWAAIGNNCNKNGVSESCRSTCGLCSLGDDGYYYYDDYYGDDYGYDDDFFS